MKLNRETKLMRELDENEKAFIELLDDARFLTLASALHGVRISDGMTTKQINAYNKIKEKMPDLAHIDEEWDFVSHENKIYIDSKSPGYNGNVDTPDQAAKYIRYNTEGYRMVFVVSGDAKIGWPVKKYAEQGIEIIKLNQFLKEI